MERVQGFEMKICSQRVYPDLKTCLPMVMPSVLFDLAAAYGYGFAKNHPFVDGNKRVAFIAMAIFLELNGYSLDVPEVDVVVMIERLATDQENQDSIAEWLRENSLKQKSWAN
jgi:death-on-curing protein